ncbi:MAG: WD40/YVTN/BNR-like repeat-containing protein, partial [Pseudonocardiaceae bacterium]
MNRFQRVREILDDAVGGPHALTWRATNAPVASSRTDDIWFIDPRRGWAVNSNGQILHTEDGFTTWEQQFHDPQVYFRCVGFASESRGWVGTLTAGKRLFETVDGGASWTGVSGLPALAPSAICGLSVVDQSVVYASGTNFPNRPARMMRTVDGGASWQAWDMSAHATLLVDTYFTDADHGWVVGGKATMNSPANPTRNDVRAVVLRTEDGGNTWVNKVASLGAELPLGEWGWKIQFLD